jgi:hypothetical protein
MVRFLKHFEIDKQKWDACIEASSSGVICALSWFLDIVAPEWQAVVLEEGETYVSVMPLAGTSKFGFSHLKAAYYCQQLGIISVRPVEYLHVAALFLDEISQRFRFIHNYKFLTENTAELVRLRSQYNLVPQFTRYLVLKRPYSEIYASYNRDRKMNLKRAQRANLQLEESDDIEPMIDFFKANVAPKLLGGFAESSYQMLRELFTKMREEKLGFLYYASHKGRLNAGGLFTNYKNKIGYIFNAADNTGRVTNGRTLILDELIQQHAHTDKVLDFESPPVPDIDEFYGSFGAKQVLYFSLYQNSLPFPIRLLRSLRIHLYRNFFSLKG